MNGQTCVTDALLIELLIAKAEYAIYVFQSYAEFTVKGGETFRFNWIPFLQMYCGGAPI